MNLQILFTSDKESMEFEENTCLLALRRRFEHLKGKKGKCSTTKFTNGLKEKTLGGFKTFMSPNLHSYIIL